ncbi:adenosylcobinamide-GDP ribazoletransferase [Pseudalkalibacillus berkeleyi]|uniref:Adenosylcobinamide-GDP ribazoletransferase n=1 Tax=Pseudalkalibacillus berkeleyi TaxID=1069813 RepID=A0ABS9GXG9_9BACL|nr:adenosylcobinamide-GDP ribazoletransferase [Pseudalkalibacillus berkeleyi]MCF6137473.1 adenosylcobinamide-GDP ribazoletransferase [Pseudalkalibacillus berkeleyi]
MNYLKGLLINIQFFTVIPLKMELPMDRNHLESSVKTFPILGLLQGISYLLFLMILVEWSPFSTLAIAFFIWLYTIIFTGGIHLDGWMDMSDAYFSYQDEEKRLEIMKDPRTGAFGVLSVIILLSAKFFFIYELIALSSYQLWFAILLIPFLSKSMMGYLLLSVKPAKEEGLAYLFHQAINGNNLWLYPVYFLLISLGLNVIVDHAFIPIITLTIITILSYHFFRIKSVHWFKGMTGDVLGASIEGVELILWMTLWLLHYFVMG